MYLNRTIKNDKLHIYFEMDIKQTPILAPMTSGLGKTMLQCCMLHIVVVVVVHAARSQR